ncbi:MAG: hypothetical protein JST47_14615 [Bacteroidetes bacterium]|nr:hypothetical protein [Bacteroidota bacterium]MBS1974509.1 hypothetical protein [Bacteroidota bacterium]
MKLYLVGGFLGSGKTTAIYNACLELKGQGVPTAVITNDQGSQLVDTAVFKGKDIPSMEVQNGCFCCHYNDLVSRIQSLEKRNQPEIIFAESVGSCTDLVATVIMPMLHFKPKIETVLSVFADAAVLYSLIHGAELFVQSVSYIYKKQLEEAELLIINKADLLNVVEMEEVKSFIEKEYPNKKVIYQNSLNRNSVREWLYYLNTFSPKTRKPLELDYHIYGAGEAALAWLDADVNIYTKEQCAVGHVIALVNKIYSKINSLNLSIGHLKFLIDDGAHQKKISFTSVNHFMLKYELMEFNSEKINVLINARVQAAPGQLEQIVKDTIKELELQPECDASANNMVAFKPGYPKPAYRFLN